MSYIDRLKDLIDGSTPLAFLHVPKSGGTSFTTHLLRTRPRSMLIGTWQELHDMEDNSLADLDLVSGHYYDFQSRRLDGLFQKITVLRDPLERIISSYTFARSMSSSIDGVLDVNQRYACEVPFKEYFYSTYGVVDRHAMLFLFGLDKDDDAAAMPLERLYERATAVIRDYRVVFTDEIDALTGGGSTDKANITPAEFRNVVALSDYDIAAMRDVLMWDYRILKFARDGRASS